jgi:hypothetical protein
LHVPALQVSVVHDRPSSVQAVPLAKLVQAIALTEGWHDRHPVASRAPLE